MRTASTILGIAGGALAVLIAIFSMIGTLAIFTAIPDVMDNALEFSDDFNYNDGDFSFDNGEFSFDNGEFSFDSDINGLAGSGWNFVATWIIISHIIAIIGGILGIVGGAIVKKKNVVAGVLMIVACVLAGFSGWGILCSIALLIGGILALVKEKTAQPAYPYPYSGYQQPPQAPPYNPYQQPQQPPYNPYQQQPQQAPPYNPYQPQQAPPAPPAPPQEPEAPKSEE